MYQLTFVIDMIGVYNCCLQNHRRVVSPKRPMLAMQMMRWLLLAVVTAVTPTLGALVDCCCQTWWIGLDPFFSLKDDVFFYKMRSHTHSRAGTMTYNYIIWHNIYIYIYIPGTCLSSILVVEPFKTRSFPNQNKGHLGSRDTYMYMIFLCIHEFNRFIKAHGVFLFFGYRTAQSCAPKGFCGPIIRSSPMVQYFNPSESRWLYVYLRFLQVARPNILTP